MRRCPRPARWPAASSTNDEVVAHRGDAGLVGDRAVAGHDHIDVHAEHQVARRDPVAQRAGPHDRRAADEQDVAGEDRPGVGHVGERVAAGVRRADLDQLDAPGRRRRGRAGRRRCGRAGAARCRRSRTRRRSCGTGRRPRPARSFSPASSDGGTSAISSAVAGCGDDLGVVDQLVAVAVVAVGVRVDDLARSAPQR